MKDLVICAVCSGKGGAGTSLVAASLAAAFARAGKNTLAVDLCPSSPALEFFFGVQDRALFGLSSCLDGKIPFDRALVRCDSPANLAVCPAPEENPFSLSAARREKFLSFVRASGCARVIIDLPAAAPDIAFSLVGAVDSWILVTTQNPASLFSCEAFGDALAARGASASVVINRFDLSDPPSYKKGRTSALDIVDTLHRPLLGIVPESYSLLRRSEEGLLASMTESSADIPFENIAARLDGKQIPLFDGIGGEKLRKKL